MNIKHTTFWKPISYIYRKTGLKAIVYSSSFRRLVKSISLADFLNQVIKKSTPLRKKEIIIVPQHIQSGPMPAEDIDAMAEILSYIEVKSIFEFGTNFGFTTALFLKNTPPDCKVFTLDICREMFNENELKSDRELDMVLSKETTGLGYKNFSNFHERVVQIFQDSLKLSWKETDYPDEFDVIFVDACHKYDYVKSDTENSLLKLKSGGLLIWHDYYPDVSAWADVFRYINDFAKVHSNVLHIKGTHLAVWVKP